MFEQHFTLSDIPQIFTLTFLELLLSADNAIVLGVLSHSLPPPLRKKALYIGVASAFIFRGGALIAISALLQSMWIQLIGGAYLFYLSIRYFSKRKKPIEMKPVRSFWTVVLLIELIDVVFAIDSIVAGIAFINGSFSKLWIVYLGGMLGILGMRYAADLFATLITRFPHIEKSAYLIIGWIGIKLGFSSFHSSIPPPLFWSVIALFFVLGFFRSKR